MEKQKMGQFICELRKSKQMTQRELAEKLNVTDKAVSKWERGLAYPDISLLSPISDVLGVTTSELLNGEKIESTSDKHTEISVGNALQYAESAVGDRWRVLRNICSISFSAMLLLGIVVCAICDVAITGSLTWSLFPVSSCIFAWVVFFPVLRFGEKGIVGSMLSFSIGLIPFLWVIDGLVKGNQLIMPIGIRMAGISIVFLWGIYVIFRVWRKRKLFATAISLLLVVPVQILIDFSLSKIIDSKMFDIWDVVSILIIALLAVGCFAYDYVLRRSDDRG